MLEELIHFGNTVLALFVIVDPFAVLPVYMTLTDRFNDHERLQTRRKAMFVALGILLFFALSGTGLFQLFGITIPAFRIAGGILLLIIGITQLMQKRERIQPSETQEGLEKDDISIFPLGTPLIAGPGAISTVVLYTSQSGSILRTTSLCIAIVTVCFLSFLFLKFSPLIYRVLGRTGLNLLTRIMGIILTAIAVQFVITGIKEAFQLG